ncbi:hypothetical protein ACO0OE_000273 [Hanseniaspora uvarum]
MVSLISFIKGTTITALVASFIGLGALYYNQNSLIYPSWVNNARVYVRKPEFPLSNYFQEDYITTRDNESIQVYSFIHNEEKRKTLLMFRPNAGNIGDSIPLIKILFESHNLNVVVWSYRGYGKSSGKPTEKGIKVDSESIYDFLVKKELIYEPTNELIDKPLILHGTSIGGAVAINFAYEHKNVIDSLILENTFLSLHKVVPYIFPWLKHFTFLVTDKWQSESIIGKLDPQMNLLILNSMKDEIVPSSHSKELYELSNSKYKKIHRFNRGHHNDLIIQDGYFEILHEFLAQREIII